MNTKKFLRISLIAGITGLLVSVPLFNSYTPTVFADGSWTQLGLSDRQVDVLADDPTNSNILYAGTDNGVYKSTDGGSTWNDTTEEGIAANVVAVAPSNHNVIYATRGNTGMQKSTDGGATWSNITNNLGTNDSGNEVILDVAVDPSDPNTAYVAFYQDHTVWKTTDGGNTWSSDDLGQDAYRIVIAPSDSSTLYLGVGNTTIYKSTDGGDNWDNPGNSGLGFGGGARGISVDPTDPNTIYVGTEGNGVYKSTDGGATFNFLSNSPSNYVGAALATDPNNSDTIYAQQTSGVAVSSDGGDTWTSLDSGDAPSSIQRVVVFANNPYDLYATSNSGGVYMYELQAPSPTPTSGPAIQIVANPSTSNVTVGTPFNVDVAVSETNGASTAFNAAQAIVSVSSNLSVTGIHNATSNACNFQYTKHPTTSDPSFAGAIYGNSSTGCTVYTMTLTPTSTGTGTITFSNDSIKAYADNSEILTGVQNGSYTINGITSPTPTSGLQQLTVTSPLQTYYLNNTYTLAGTKDANTTTVYVNGSSSGVTYPTSTTWQVSESLAALGENNTPSDNTFTIYGSNGTNQTATQTIDVSRHTLGDINGDGTVDLTDASLFAADWGKTDPSTFTYALSDMNDDGSIDLTDLSILAKLEQ